MNTPKNSSQRSEGTIPGSRDLFLVKGGCGHSGREVEASSLIFGACFITALLIMGVMTL
ncbi:MAG: hypothetical protein PHV82_08110 [Victivallaceae bacterium]|nr:hypothetical protein [Victivallaceae bacterium]